MKSKTFSVTSTQLNGTVHSIDPKMERTVDASGSNVTQTLYPKGIQLVNTSGADLEYVIISSEKEDDEFTKNQATPGRFPFYDFILLPTNATLSESNMVVCYKFYIKKVSSDTSNPIRVDFKQYS